jgi:hypothetical protein
VEGCGFNWEIGSEIQLFIVVDPVILDLGDRFGRYSLFNCVPILSMDFYLGQKIVLFIFCPIKRTLHCGFLLPIFFIRSIKVSFFMLYHFKSSGL